MPTDRMPPIPDAKLTEAQRTAVADIIKGPRGALVGPFFPLMRSPDFMGRLQRTGEYLRFNSALEPRLAELAILMTARLWTQQFEWHHHRILAEKAGLKAAVIDAIAEGRRPDGMAEDEVAIYDFLDELTRTRGVSDPTYAKVAKLFGERGVIDLCGLHGYYSMLAIVMNVARTPLPAGTKPGLGPMPAT